MPNNTISQVEVNGTTYDLLDMNTLSAVSAIERRVTALEDSVSSMDYLNGQSVVPMMRTTDLNDVHTDLSDRQMKITWLGHQSTNSPVPGADGLVLTYRGDASWGWQVVIANASICVRLKSGTWGSWSHIN